MKVQRLLLSLAVLVFAGAVVVGGTGAFFSDEETSTANAFTAGDIDLQIDNESYVTATTTIPDVQVAGELIESPWTSWEMTDLVAGTHKFFDFTDLKPGDVGEDTISIHVGSNDAWVCAAARITEDADNSITEPEDEVDNIINNSDGTADGDLDSEVNFMFWHDDGDNVLEEDEAPFINGSLADLGAQDQIALADSEGSILGGNTPIPGDSTFYIGKAWCYGELTKGDVAQDDLGKTGTNGPLQRGTGVNCDGAVAGNIGQTDSVKGDMQFYAVQSRNNDDFTCSEWRPDFVIPQPSVIREEISSNDLATDQASLAAGPDKWLFYNDTNDTIMTINQFSGTGGVNDIVVGPGATGAAQMTLDSGTNPRYNIATYRYKDVKLSDIGSLKYRIYDASPSAETPYLHFNVDFNNSDTWQQRLVQVPTGVVVNTWTTVDALAGMWTYSGATWPVGLVDVTGTTPGTTPRTWADILANWPNAETRSTDSFLGVRVGHPGPNGETGYVDWVEFDGFTSDFQN